MTYTSSANGSPALGRPASWSAANDAIITNAFGPATLQEIRKNPRLKEAVHAAISDAAPTLLNKISLERQLPEPLRMKLEAYLEKHALLTLARHEVNETNKALFARIFQPNEMDALIEKIKIQPMLEESQYAFELQSIQNSVVHHIRSGQPDIKTLQDMGLSDAQLERVTVESLAYAPFMPSRKSSWTSQEASPGATHTQDVNNEGSVDSAHGRA